MEDASRNNLGDSETDRMGDEPVLPSAAQVPGQPEKEAEQEPTSDAEEPDRPSTELGAEALGTDGSEPEPDLAGQRSGGEPAPEVVADVDVDKTQSESQWTTGRRAAVTVVGFVASLVTLAQAADLIGGPSAIDIFVGFYVSIFGAEDIEAAEDEGGQPDSGEAGIADEPVLDERPTTLGSSDSSFSSLEPHSPTAENATGPGATSGEARQLGPLDVDQSSTSDVAVETPDSGTVSEGTFGPTTTRAPTTYLETTTSRSLGVSTTASSASKTQALATTQTSTGASAALVPALAFGEINQGNLDGTGDSQRWTFVNSTNATDLIIDLVYLGSPGDCGMDVEVHIESASGRRVGGAVYMGGSCLGHKLSLDGPGEYNLVWTVGTGYVLPSVAGEYRFVALLAEAPHQHTAQLGVANEGNIETLYGEDEWSLSVDEGGRHLVLEMLTAGPHGDCHQDLNLQIIDPLGRYQWPDIYAGGNVCGEEVRRELPIAGVYTLQFSGGQGYVIRQRTGPYSFLVSID